MHFPFWLWIKYLWTFSLKGDILAWIFAIGHCKENDSHAMGKGGEHYLLKTNVYVANEKNYFVKNLEIVLQQVMHGATQLIK